MKTKDKSRKNNFERKVVIMALFVQSNQMYIFENGEYGEDNYHLRDLGIRSLSTSDEETHITVHHAQIKNDPVLFYDQHVSFIDKLAKRYSLKAGKVITFSFKQCRGIYKQTTLVHLNSQLKKDLIVENNRKNRKITIISPSKKT